MIKLSAKVLPENQLSLALGSDRYLIQILNNTTLKTEQFNTLFFEICEDPVFVSWASSFSTGNSSNLHLSKIIFEQIELEDSKTSSIPSSPYSRLFLSIVIEETIKSEEPQVQTRKVSVQLENANAATLIIFRLNPPLSSAPIRNEQQIVNQPRPREFVLFIKKPLYASGFKNFLQIPHGVVSSRKFVGEDAQILKNVANLEAMSDYHLIEMTSFCGRKTQHSSRNGVSVAPHLLGGKLRLYLYRETISLEEVERLQRLSGDAVPGVELCALNEAWWKTSDAVSLSALFLFHELRYHSLMPKYKPPREPKKNPMFMSVGDLDPNGHGYNLRVRISSDPAHAIVTSHGNQTVYEYIVGDTTGCVLLRLSSEQHQETSLLLTPGSSIILRNVDIDMTGNHIAIIINHFSKLDKSVESFNFEINHKNNMSSFEYEEQVIDSSVSQRMTDNSNRYSRNRRLRRQMHNDRGRAY